MTSLDGLFSKSYVNQEQIEIESIVNEVITIMSDVANEASSGRTFSCDDVAEVLMYYRRFFEGQQHLLDILSMLTETLQNAQHSMSGSIKTELDLLLTTGLTSSDREIITQIRDDEKIYNWIRTTSV